MKALSNNGLPQARKSEHQQLASSLLMPFVRAVVPSARPVMTMAWGRRRRFCSHKTHDGKACRLPKTRTSQSRPGCGGRHEHEALESLEPRHARSAGEANLPFGQDLTKRSAKIPTILYWGHRVWEERREAVQAGIRNRRFGQLY
jgi:hypothetical protein